MRVDFCRSVTALALSAIICLSPILMVHAQSAPPAQSVPPSASTPAPTPTPEPTPQPEPTPKTLSISLGRQYTHSRSWLSAYAPIDVEQPELSNTQVEDLIRGGRLELSLQNAVELALENNTDIIVQRYYPWIADTDLLRSQANTQGNALRGIGNAVIPNAFAAINGITFDPALTTTFNVNSRRIPVNNPLIAGTGVAAIGPQSLFTHTSVASVQYSQGFHTGTAFAVGFNSVRASTTSPAQLFSPSVQSGLTLSFSQQLLNGFGRMANERFIRIAQISKQASNFGFVQSVINNITQVENNYWELVFARGDVTVRQRSVELAQRLVEDNRRQVEIGTLAPIEVVRAEAQLGLAQLDLINSQTYQLQQQALLKSLITKNPLDPAVRDAEVVPTDTAQVPPLIEILPLADAVQEALQKRPDIQQNELGLCADDINVRSTRNALLPTFTMSGYFSSVGLAGNTRGANPATSGFGTAANTVLRADYPEYQAQVTMNLPLKNRAAQADHARALLQERQNQARRQQLHNTVAVEVQNTQIALQQARAAVTAARTTRQLQEQTLAAEQTKFQLGASTIFLVVQAQRDLATAASAEVRASSNLAKARANFEKATGRTLEAKRINTLDELGTGRCEFVPQGAGSVASSSQVTTSK